MIVLHLRARLVLATALACACLLPVRAETPPAEPPKQPPTATPPAINETGPVEPPVVADDLAWGLPGPLLESLAQRADQYREYLVRFSCDESARVAHYDDANEASKESTKTYAYLLERDARAESFREYRTAGKKKENVDAGSTAGAEVDEESKFPPAYAWVFLFSRFDQPYFMYRSLGERFEGFDWVHEIQFRGALPFTDGKDIRQWEGTVLVDAATFAPVEVRAEPSSQKDRIKAMFERWNRAFNIVGAKVAPRPFGYRCRVGFGLRQDRLNFPTELRYDTFRAVGPKKFIPWMASVRVYEKYQFYKTSTTETPAVPVGP